MQSLAQGEPAIRGEGGPLRSRADLPVNVATILALALPTIVEQLFSAGVGFTDTIVAGHTGPTANAHAAASAAVGTMTYLQWFSGLMTSALGVGATAIVARSIGARRPRLATRVAGTVCSAALLVGIGVALAFYLFPAPIAGLFGLRGLASDYGVEYLRIMSLTVCLQCAGQIGMACLRGAGDTVRPMIVTIAIFLINAIASPALAFGWFGLPAMGISGNAIGTLLSFAAAGFVTFGFLTSGGGAATSPPALQNYSASVAPGAADRIAVVAGRDAAVDGAGPDRHVRNQSDGYCHRSDGRNHGAHTAVLRIESFAFLPGFGFGIACSALVGQYLGARKPDDAKRAANLSNRLALITMTVAAIPMIVMPRFLLGLMVDAESVVRTGTLPLILAGLAQPAFAVAIARAAALKARGTRSRRCWRRSPACFCGWCWCSY